MNRSADRGFRISGSSVGPGGLIRNPPSAVRDRKGVALLIVLWIMAILTLLMYSFLGDMQVEYSIAGGYGDTRKAEQLAWSAIDLGAATVANETQAWQSLSDTTWANNPTTFYDVELGDGAFSLFRPTYDDQQTVLWGLDDEASKINLNTASREILLKLPNMTAEIADAILDWRDADANPGASGAESSYYNSLNPPYNCKNAPFETLEELLYVKGMTPALLFGEDFNLNGVLDPNENDGDEQWPPDNRDGRLDPGLWSLCTVWSSDRNVDANGARRANLNSAPPDQLAASGLTPTEVQMITLQRQALPFLSVAQLLGNAAVGLQPITPRERFALVVDKLAVVDDQAVPGLVNINTCPKQVLLSLPGITDEFAVKIMEYRTTPGNDLSNMGWLLNVVEPAVLQGFAPFITCRSYQFRIHAVGRVGTPYNAGAGSDSAERPRAFRRMVAVFDRLATPTPRLVYWKDQTKLGMPYDPQDGPTPTR